MMGISPHPDHRDDSENREVAVVRPLEQGGRGDGGTGVCDQRLKGQDVPGCQSHCLLPATLGTDTRRLARLVARLRLHLVVMLLIFEIDMLFRLLIFFKKKSPKDKNDQM